MIKRAERLTEKILLEEPMDEGAEGKKEFNTEYIVYETDEPYKIVGIRSTKVEAESLAWKLRKQNPDVNVSFEAVKKGKYKVGSLFEDFEIQSEPKVTLDVEADEKNKEENMMRVDSGVTSLLNSAVVSKFNSVDMFNSVLATLELMIQENNLSQEAIDNYTNIRAIIYDVVNEENVHIGQLQKALVLVSGSATFIDRGKEEAEEIIKDEVDILGDE